MPTRSYNAQYAAPQVTDPYYGNYSALAKQLAAQRHAPVQSIGQGLADVLGDVGEAYFDRKEREKAAKQQGADNAALAKAIAFASDPTKNTMDTQRAQGQTPMPNMQWDEYAFPQATTQQRMAAALAGIPDRVKMDALPMIADAAKSAEPRYSNVDGVGLVKVPPGGGPPSVAIAANKGSTTPHNVTTAQGVFAQNPDGSLGERLGDAAREPKNVQTVTTADGIFVLNSDQTLGKKLGDAPAREKMPKMQTYYDEDGRQLQLDSNDPEDQKTIKAQGLVTSGPTDSERASKGYLDRMQRSEDEMMKIIDSGFDPGNLKDTAGEAIGGNYGVSDKYRQFWQLASDWYRAKLRKESGAVIGDSETKDEVKTYFPRPGDDDVTKGNKTKSRVEAQRQLATTAGLLGRKRLRDLSGSVPNGPLDYSKMTDDQIKAALAARQAM